MLNFFRKKPKEEKIEINKDMMTEFTERNIRHFGLDFDQSCCIEERYSRYFEKFTKIGKKIKKEIVITDIKYEDLTRHRNFSWDTWDIDIPYTVSEKITKEVIELKVGEHKFKIFFDNYNRCYYQVRKINEMIDLVYIYPNPRFKYKFYVLKKGNSLVVYMYGDTNMFCIKRHLLPLLTRVDDYAKIDLNIDLIVDDTLNLSKSELFAYILLIS